MKILIYGTVLATSILSCASKPRDHYRYKISGEVQVLVEKYVDWDEVNITEERKKAIAYTDTIHGLNEDSIWYWNTDGSKVTILKPYRIDTLK
jgi:hypothetical protein